MAIVGTDILMKYSVKTGSAGDSTAGTAAGSLGKYVSTTAITTATLNNLFDDVSGAEAAAGMVDYRSVFIHNNHASLTLYGATVTLTSQTAGGGTIDIALDNVAASAKGSASAQGAEIANEAVAPTPVGAFGSTPLVLGDLAPGQVRQIWLRRTVTAGAGPLNPDGLILTPGGDTLP